MLNKSQQLPAVAAATTLLASIAAYTLFSINRRSPSLSREVIPSPRTTLLPYLSKDQAARLPYPPDSLPGSRDVDTPYGSMRVYEWGPETGRKVIFVHGDATPSPVFRSIANDLVVKGCRVMMFDLWGRGYTDTPADSQHDCRLYGLQIQYAIMSSPISWTGGAAGRFSLVGFSMGGTIILDFFAHNPKLVESVVLLAPGGLIHQLPPEYRSFWYNYPSMVSKFAMRRLIGSVLGVNVTGGSIKSTTDVELTDDGFTPTGALQFQFDHHSGHAKSFLSTIQYGPLQHQEAIWEEAGKIVRQTGFRDGVPLSGGKILCICGAEDSVVVPAEVRENLHRFFGGPDHFRFQTVPGGHGFPWTEGSATAGIIASFWGL